MCAVRGVSEVSAASCARARARESESERGINVTEAKKLLTRLRAVSCGH